MYGDNAILNLIMYTIADSPLSKMSYDTPLSAQGQQLTDLPLKDQLRRGFRDMGSRSYSTAKNFGVIGAIFTGTECCIESVSVVPQGWKRSVHKVDLRHSIARKAIGRTVYLLDASLGVL